MPYRNSCQENKKREDINEGAKDAKKKTKERTLETA